MNIKKLTQQLTYLQKKAKQKIQREGLLKTIGDLSGRVGNSLLETFRKSDYQHWIENFEPTTEDLEKQKEISKSFIKKPLISIIVPTYETDAKMLTEMLDSVINQTYGNWELCIADGASKETHIKAILLKYSKKDTRLKIKFLEVNKGIVGNSNEALKLCQGGYVGLLDHDDLLAPFALFEVVKCINEEGPDFIYSDEDIINARGTKRYQPHFKPAWSPDTLRSYNYITHFSIFKRELLEKIGGFREGFEGSQDHDLILRAGSIAQKIVHIPKILYHWRAHPLSMAGNLESKTYVFDSAKKAVKEACQKEGFNCQVTDGFFLGSYRIRYEIKDKPKVAIIIPFKDEAGTKNETEKAEAEYKAKAEILKNCLNSIQENTDYDNYQILLLSQQKKTSTYRQPLEAEFNNIKLLDLKKKLPYPESCNFAAQYTDAEYLLFLDQELQVLNSDWLQSMLELAQRKDAGVVGAKILNSDKTLHHAGIVLGMQGQNGQYGYVCQGLSEEEIAKRYYCRYLVNTIRNVSAVSGSCMLINKKKFLQVKGFKADGQETKNWYESNIVLALKMSKLGLVNIYTPYATLIYSKAIANKTRAVESVKGEGGLPRQDPYYSLNLDYQRTTPSVAVKNKG